MTVIPESICAEDEARGLGDEFPVYHATVSAEPLTREVALLAGEGTRNGGCGAVMVVVPVALVVAVPLAEEKPNAASAACAFGSEAEADIEKLAALPVFSVMAPPSTDEGVEGPVIESIFDSSV